MIKQTSVLVLTLLFLSCPSWAQDAPPKYDCEEHAEHRQFDFWLGEWEVHIADGRKAGENSVSSANRGCLINESWTNVQGITGSSINHYHPGTGKWRQLWVDSFSVIDISGGLDEGSMVLTGSIYYYGERRTADFRGRWTPLEDGRVRQFFEEKDAEGKWNTWFEGFYSRKADADEAENAEG